MGSANNTSNSDGRKWNLYLTTKFGHKVYLEPGTTQKKFFIYK